ncbi:MmyB family transcriptional regulator [Nonomuraea rubra]
MAPTSLTALVSDSSSGRRFCTESDRAAQAAVAILRQAACCEPDNPRLVQLVHTLTDQSASVPVLKRAHRARRPRRPSTSCISPFDVRDAPGRQFVITTRVPGSGHRTQVPR